MSGKVVVMLTLDRRTTALALIDLQLGILSLPTVPHSAREVIETGKALAARFRAAAAPVILVNVDW